MQACFEIEMKSEGLICCVLYLHFEEVLNMTKILFQERSGGVREIDANPGMTVMQLAIQENIRGIDAECGGACACATCHVYIDDAHAQLLPPPTQDEAEMLDGVAAERRETSRLACQVVIADDLNGMIVEVPDRQF